MRCWRQSASERYRSNHFVRNTFSASHKKCSCFLVSAVTITNNISSSVIPSPLLVCQRFISYDELGGQLPQNIVIDPLAKLKQQMKSDEQHSSLPLLHRRRHRRRWLEQQQQQQEEQEWQNKTVDSPDETSKATSKTEQSVTPLIGLDKVYGNRASSAMHNMLGPQGWTDAVQSKALPILGRATIEGTRYTVERSTIFENWFHECAPPVKWHLSKLGSATCKMPNNVNEAAESLQLQIIKGCNVFEIDGAASEVHQNVSVAIREAFEAFELSRDGFVMVVRCGVLTQPLFQDEITKASSINTAHIRNRVLPAFERLKASSIPSMQLKSGFNISEMTEEQLSRLHLRRVSKRSAAGLTPDWIEAFITNVAFNTKLECIDVILIEGIHTLFDGRSSEEVDEDIIELFAYLEQQVKAGFLQYYGVSSPHLAPPIIRHYPPMPEDAVLPDIFKTPPIQPEIINLYRLLHLAERVGGKEQHHFRFIEYPFNFTAHQALSTPLPYDTNHTLLTLCKALGFTTLGCTPLETTNLMHQPERYHNFPLESDLKSTRLNFLSLCERCTAKEMEIKDSIVKGPKTLPQLHELFAAGVYLTAQRQFANLFFFEEWLKHRMMPTFRRAVMQFKEASSSDLKEWCKQYEQMVNDFFRLRHRLFQHKHGAKAARINMVIDYVSPTLAKCPMLNQKAINFATYGCDVVIAGFHVSRYFHEATELNPAKNGELKIPYEELEALCANAQISYADASPPHPYMLEPPLAQGRFSKQKRKTDANSILIDLRNPKFPDIPEEIDGTPATTYTNVNNDKDNVNDDQNSCSKSDDASNNLAEKNNINQNRIEDIKCVNDDDKNATTKSNNDINNIVNNKGNECLQLERYLM